MKKTLSALFLCLIVSAGAALSASAANIVSVKGGTPVAVHIVGQLSSSTAHVGQTFRITMAGPLVVRGWVAAPEGATGQGTVETVSPAGSSGRQGKLSLAFDWVFAADGSKIPLSATNSTSAGKNKTGSSNAANVAATVLLGPVGLFAHNFVKGKDVNVGPSQKFEAYVNRTVLVRASHPYSTQ